MPYINHQRGTNAEHFACHYLEQQGLQLITQNFRTKLGEIDLIMRDKNALVFVEVRYRKPNSFGGSIESITLSKQRKLIKTALFYLQINKLVDKIPCRFDVVGIISIQSPPVLEWIKDAFQLT